MPEELSVVEGASVAEVSAALEDSVSVDSALVEVLVAGLGVVLRVVFSADLE